jgi:hypothetical protein
VLLEGTSRRLREVEDHRRQDDLRQTRLLRPDPVPVETSSRRPQVYCIAGIACARLQQGDDRAAARLWGIAEDQERQLGFRMLATERKRYERLMVAARERLDDAYELVYGDGIGLTLEQAIVEARLHLRG